MILYVCVLQTRQVNPGKHPSPVTHCPQAEMSVLQSTLTSADQPYGAPH